MAGIEAGQAQARRYHRRQARRQAANGCGQDTNVVGRRAAATADNVQDAVASPVGKFVREHCRRFVIAAEGIGQTGIGVGRDEAIADARQFLDVLA